MIKTCETSSTLRTHIVRGKEVSDISFRGIKGEATQVCSVRGLVREGHILPRGSIIEPGRAHAVSVSSVGNRREEVSALSGSRVAVSSGSGCVR